METRIRWKRISSLSIGELRTHQSIIADQIAELELKRHKLLEERAKDYEFFKNKWIGDKRIIRIASSISNAKARIKRLTEVIFLRVAKSKLIS